MANFTTLPTELRQRILSLALPATAYLRYPSSTSVFNLMHINRRLRLDMGPVVRLWRPIHYLSSPTQLPQFQSPGLSDSISPSKVERICLGIFPESQEYTIKWTCFCVEESNFTHHELVQAWIDAVPQLPADIKEIHIDMSGSCHSISKTSSLYLAKLKSVSRAQ